MNATVATGQTPPLLNARGVAQLVALMGVIQKARALADPTAFTFLVVNETRLVTPYRQAALWRAGVGGGGYVEGVSGLAVADQDAPYILWLSAVLKHLHSDRGNGSGGAIALAFQEESRGAGGHAHLPEGHLAVTELLPAALAEGWQSWMPAYGLWLPLTFFQGESGAVLALGGLF
ncbi:MAG: hypothetical protein HQL80_09300, partial [Magnetococcales bacterium]|nr:hypothetical protein [Magnetococcales bacterium]